MKVPTTSVHVYHLSMLNYFVSNQCWKRHESTKKNILNGVFRSYLVLCSGLVLWLFIFKDLLTRNASVLWLIVKINF